MARGRASVAPRTVSGCLQPILYGMTFASGMPSCNWLFCARHRPTHKLIVSPCRWLGFHGPVIQPQPVHAAGPDQGNPLTVAQIAEVAAGAVPRMVAGSVAADDGVPPPRTKWSAVTTIDPATLALDSRLKYSAGEMCARGHTADRLTEQVPLNPVYPHLQNGGRSLCMPRPIIPRPAMLWPPPSTTSARV